MSDLSRRDLFKSVAAAGAISVIKAEEIGPKDLIVLKTERDLSLREIEVIRDQWRVLHLPGNVIILQGGMDIGVLRHADIT